MLKGYLSLVLHAHLPFVKHPEYQEALEEHWLFEAMTECYIPLLLVFERLVEERVPFRMAMTLSPTLLEMLGDSLLQGRYLRHLEKLIDLAEKEVARTRAEPAFHSTACLYLDHFKRCRSYFLDRAKSNLIYSFRRLMETGCIEILTCAATHGFLPLMAVEHDASVRAQVAVAVKNYRKHFERFPRGIWLPECGYFPGDDRILKECGLQFFFMEAHGLLHARPPARQGAFVPCLTPSGVGVFGRDSSSSKQVWSAKEGYPGDGDYREFYRDVGWDLDYEYIRPYLHESGIRKEIGIKYYRITGSTPLKEPYSFERARGKAAIHAADFINSRGKQVEHLHNSFNGAMPIVAAPYDAELFGHWWFEGPLFLDFLFRKLHFDQDVIKAITPLEYLELYPECQVVEPELSSWGNKGYCEVWLNESNDWIYRHLHHAAKKMVEAARDFPSSSGLEERVLNQMARECLLAQASDWAFIMKTGTVVDYAIRRTKEHLSSFLKLEDELRGKRVERSFLADLEGRNSLFPEIDYRVYAASERIQG